VVVIAKLLSPEYTDFTAFTQGAEPFTRAAAIPVDVADRVLSQTQTKDVIGSEAGCSGSEYLELLGEWCRIVGVPRLSFAHHVDHLDTGQDDRCGRLRLETQHRPDPALDAPVILLDAVVIRHE
jgi:hypothetical protein